MEIITKKGFKTNIDPDALDDAELFEWIIDVDKEDYTHLFDIVTSLFGEDGKKELYNFLRGGNGKVKMTDVTEAVSDVIEQLNKNQNKKK